MEFIYAFLSAIQIVFIVVNIFTTLFFRLDRAVVHQVITTAIITIAYVLEGVLNIINEKMFMMFIFSMLLAMVWGLNLCSSIRRMKRINKLKKEFEEKQKENHL